MNNKLISELTNQTAPLDADVFPIYNTANSTINKLSWLNIKAALKTYFDTLYSTYVLIKSAVEAVLTGVITSHSHAAQTSVTGNAGTATKLAATKMINGVTFDGSLVNIKNTDLNLFVKYEYHNYKCQQFS